MRDLYSNLGAVLALAPAVQAAAVTGSAIALPGKTGIIFAVSTGTIAGDGEFGLTVQESDDGVTWAEAPADHVQSDAPDELEAGAVYRLGYIGWKRQVRLSLTKAGGTSIIAGAVAIFSPDVRPVP